MDTPVLDLNLFLSIEPHVGSGMSNFQMEHFVINDHITPYRCFKQAVIEARARLETITSYGFDMEELHIKRDDAISRAEMMPVTKDQKLANVEARRMNFEIDRKQKLIDQMHHEAQFFLDKIETIAQTQFGGPEGIKKLIQDPMFVHEGEKNFWIEKLTRGVIGDMVNFGTVSKGLYEALLSLPAEINQQIVQTGIAKHQEHVMLALQSKDAVLVAKD